MFHKVAPILNPHVRELCTRPYPLHPNGCPNFAKKPGCPPMAPMLHATMDLSQSVWAIWTTFDFSGHIERMRAIHPGWSERQLTCCLYWQTKARKNLESKIGRFLWDQGQSDDLVILRCPEACGVDITSTMACLGVTLKWPPKSTTYQVALAGFAKPMWIMKQKNERVDCPDCGRSMRRQEGRKYLCPARCLTRPITRSEAASWLKKKAANSAVEIAPGGLLY